MNCSDTGRTESENACSINKNNYAKIAAMNAKKLDSDDFFNGLRQKEYARLDQTGQVYLDYTGGNLYPESLIGQHHGYLKKWVYGNPHSNSPASRLSGKHIEEARHEVLRYFNATDYECVFTANATGALQIVGECYPFSGGHLLLTADNHNSVNGIREYCKKRGGTYSYCPMNNEDLSIDEAMLTTQLSACSGKKARLVAFPAQSNASGVKHSLGWIKKAKAQGWDVLLDAAAFVPGSSLDLSVTDADFVSISFYKMFGYPTGLGCLLVKKRTFCKLKKPWFAGGTVSLVSVRANNHFLCGGFGRFENGTVNYLDIPAITNGLRFINRIGMERISRRNSQLVGLLTAQLQQLRHPNGSSLVKLYGPKDPEKRGGNMLMNFFDSAGNLFPLQCIEQKALEKRISLRTGCFCNPGIDEIISGISAGQLNDYFRSRATADYNDMTRFLGKPRGAVRISVGIPTVTADIDRFINFVKTFTGKTAPEGAHAKRRRAVSNLFNQ